MPKIDSYYDVFIKKNPIDGGGFRDFNRKSAAVGRYFNRKLAVVGRYFNRKSQIGRGTTVDSKCITFFVYEKRFYNA